MPSSSEYSSHLSSEAVSFLLMLPRRKQRNVLDIADRLADHPFKVSDYQTEDAVGHTVENILIDEFHYTYWVDHAVREVRITEIIKV